MTLDEAIKHCEEVAEENEKFCFKKGRKGGYFNEDTDWDNKKCAAEHRQLAKWLRDYKRLLDQTSWIPVSEKLPERNKEVIVTDIETSDTYLSQYIGNGYWECDNGLFKNRIIAWMPQPLRYKAERSEK